MKKRIARFFSVALLLCSIGLGGCGKEEQTGPVDPETPPKEEVSAGAQLVYELNADSESYRLGRTGGASIESLTVDEWQGKPVTEIPANAFLGCDSLREITLSDGVLAIGENAFSNTGYYLNEANWEGGALYLGKHLIRVKNTVSGGFSIKEGTLSIADGAFSDCTALTSVSFPQSLVYIGKRAFCHCTELREVELPESLEFLGRAAFSDCENLEEVSLAEVGTEIGMEAFSGTKILEENWEGDALYLGNHLIRVKETVSGSFSIKEGTLSIADGAFFGCEEIEEVSIPESVKVIGESRSSRIEDNRAGAFAGCKNLQEANLPREIEKIGIRTFYCCKSLKSADVNAERVGWEAFKNCEALEQVTLGSNLKNLGQSAFYGCKALGEIVLPDSPERVPNNAFWGCVSLERVDLGNVERIGNGAFSGCNRLTEIALDGVREIGTGAFYHCRSLKEVRLSEMLTEISDDAFRLCEGLETVTFGTNLERIGNRAFSECALLREIALEGVNRIGTRAFYGCKSLKKVTLSEKLEEIADETFRLCEGLEEATFGESLKKIGKQAFAESGLKKAVFSEPGNWTVKIKEGEEEKEEEVSVSDASAAAELLRESCSDVEWNRMQ